MWAITAKELRILLLSPQAWVLLAAAQWLLAWVFLGAVDTYLQSQGKLAALPGMGFTTFVLGPLSHSAALVSMTLAALLAMRAISGERQQGTFVLLLSAPVSDIALVTGKYLAILIFLLPIHGLALAMMASLAAGGAVDGGHTAVVVLGLVLLTAAAAAIGMFCSAMTSQPVIAAVCTLALLLSLWSVDWAGDMAGQSGLFARLSAARHFQSFQRGLVDSRDILYFLLVTASFWGLAVLQLRRVRAGSSLFFSSGARHASAAILLLASAVAVTWLLESPPWGGGPYYFQQDWTTAQAHSLSEASVNLARSLVGPVAATAYVPPVKTRTQGRIRTLFERYQQHKPDLTLNFIDPQNLPAQARDSGITREGEIILTYQARSTRLTELSEEALTKALHRLQRQDSPWIVFVSGHGERDPLGQGSFDLGLFGEQLLSLGLRVQPLLLGDVSQVPANTAVLVIAGPRISLLPQENAAILQYVADGGNLLWLLEPGSLSGLDNLAEQFSLRVKPGVLVDPESHKFFHSNTEETMLLAQQYGSHKILENFQSPTLFAEAVALSVTPDQGWEIHPLVQTSSRAWAETTPTTQPGQDSKFDEDRDIRGPLTLAALLTRPVPHGQQRIAMVGDGDFLANSYLGNGGNLDFGLRLLNWLAEDDRLIQIPPVTRTDAQLTLSYITAATISLGFLFMLPILLLVMGIWISWYRRPTRQMSIET